jgi:hypothetical protein
MFLEAAAEQEHRQSRDHCAQLLPNKDASDHRVNAGFA